MKESLAEFRQSAIKNDAVAGTLAHSLLLISHDSYALQNYAKLLAQTLMCKGEDKPCQSCTECIKIEHNNNVDVLTFPKNNKVLNSVEIAELIDLAYQAPYSADKKIFILNDFNSIDASMQNKLLKTLEEPPQNTYFILLATEDNNILPTIKSRCRSVFLKPTSTEEIAEILKSKNLDAEAQKLILNYCENNCSLALKYADFADFKKVVTLANEILQYFRHSSQMLEYASKLYAFGDEFELFLSIFLKNCGDAVEILCSQQNENKIAQIVAKEFSVNALVQMVRECNVFLEKRRRNCNYNALVDSFLFMILEVRHKWRV